jgi:hypothetical protein
VVRRKRHQLHLRTAIRASKRLAHLIHQAGRLWPVIRALVRGELDGRGLRAGAGSDWFGRRWRVTGGELNGATTAPRFTMPLPRPARSHRVRVRPHRGRTHSRSYSRCSREPLLALPRVAQGQHRDLQKAPADGGELGSGERMCRGDGIGAIPIRGITLRFPSARSPGDRLFSSERGIPL